MYFLDTATAVASVHTFWSALISALPGDVTVQVENLGDTIDAATGTLTGAWLNSPVAPVTGTNAERYPAPSGVVVNWLTDTVADGHRLKGRTFIVPLGGSLYETDGTILNTFVTDLQGIGQDLIDSQSESFVVWHRPRAARAADGSRPAVTARAGATGLITGSRVLDKAAVLRSRRD